MCLLALQQPDEHFAFAPVGPGEIGDQREGSADALDRVAGVDAGLFRPDAARRRAGER